MNNTVVLVLFVVQHKIKKEFNMRFYGFGNYYLSSLQQALQAHHVGQEMSNMYLAGNTVKATPKSIKLAREFFSDWSNNHKTIILLNGGNCRDLDDLYTFFLDGCTYGVNQYPYGKFNEDEQSLNNALTSVGIVLPAMIYTTAEIDRQHRTKDWSKIPEHIKFVPQRPLLNDWQEELITRLNSCGLAK